MVCSEEYDDEEERVLCCSELDSVRLPAGKVDMMLRSGVKTSQTQRDGVKTRNVLKHIPVPGG